MNNKTILRYCSFFLFVFSLFQLGGCRTTSEGTAHANEVSSSPRASVHFRTSGSPKQIALLLPASGTLAESGTAIREGFFASYYESQAGSPKPNVRLYDTNKGNVQSLYRQAIADGADFVVGPLSKEEVRQLSVMSSSQRPIPILALNTHPVARSASGNFMQFSLAPETEAEQIAEKAKQQGYQSAGVIVPDNAWGRRVAAAFSTRWQRLGGTVRSQVYSNPAQDHSADVRRLLGVKEPAPGQKRQKAKDPMQDKPQIALDFIMMAAPPDQARQLKPLLSFYYADNIPVYATSSIYSGSPNPARDNDLNGIVFCDMPCMLNQQRARELQSLLAKHGSIQSDQYNRLFAMGVDAYQLSMQMDHLQSNGQYSGATGLLTLDGSNELGRSLHWAKIRGGVPAAL